VRSPLYQHGADGHIRRPRLPILDQAVGLVYLNNARGDCDVPERVEEGRRPAFMVPLVLINAYLNTGEWM
jgi:hypothetical protein